MISIVIPCFNESGNVALVAEAVSKALNVLGEPFEIIFVDDGSKDDTLLRLKQLQSKQIRSISFSRNFGHQAALKAGLDHARGDAVITMDGDLQHPPALLPVLIAKWREGHQVVNTVREKTRNEGIFKKITSRLFYSFFEWFTGLPLEPGSADFRLLDQRVVEELRKFNEPSVFLRGMVSWLGFRTAQVSYTAEERKIGRTKYSLRKMLIFARDGLMAFSIRPLRLAGVLGLFVSGVSGLYIIYTLWVVAFTDKAVKGWASLLMSVLFVGGVQMIFLGLLGEYVGKLFLENKRRPVYVVKEMSQ